MRWLIVGAGALGGYFGGRLAQAGHDVTFLLRARRMAQIKAGGLVIHSPCGDTRIDAPACVQAQDLKEPFDVVVVGCKAYDLDQAMESFAPAVGPDTAILPLLNGMRHLDQLSARFGSRHVLGGLCMISAALDADGAICHFNKLHTLAFGELDGAASPRVKAIADVLASARFDSHASDDILQEMWEKWVMIASAAGITCLMRAAIGDIVSAGAADLATAIMRDSAAIAEANGHAMRSAARERILATLTTPGSTLTASMLKDIERGAAIEGEQIIGDLIARARTDMPATAPLRIVHAHLKAYETRRARES